MTQESESPENPGRSTAPLHAGCWGRIRAGRTLRGKADAWRRLVGAHALDALGMLAAVAYAAPSIGYPFGFDQPIHWYIGRRLLDGEMPYAAGVSTKPPGVFVVYALAQAVLGDELWAIRVVDLLFLLATGVLVATFRARRRGRDGRVASMPPQQPGEVGAACLALAGIYYTYFDFSDTAHPELWQGFFMLASAWAIVRAPCARVTLRRALGAGILACIAVTFKHVAAITGVICGAAVVGLALARRDVFGSIRGAAAFAGGVALVLGLVLGLFWVAGSFEQFWELMVDYILRYAAGAGGRFGVPRWLTASYGLYMVVACSSAFGAGIGVVSAAGNHRERWVGLWILTSLIGALASVAVQKRVFGRAGFTYHFVVVVPFLALCLSWGLRQALPRNGMAQLAVVVFLVGASFLQAPAWTFNRAWDYRQEWASFWDYVNGRRSYDEYHRVHQNGRIESNVRLHRVAVAIECRKEAGDTLCVDGFIAHLYQMTGLRCPSRFLIGDGVGDVRAWHEEYARMLDETPPTFFVTFPDRPRARELVRRGYRRHDVRAQGVTYSLMIRDQARALSGRHAGCSEDGSETR